MEEQTDVLIVGTGFSGLGMAIALGGAGLDDYVVVEKAGDVGGTWRDNTYPGCACDVPSHLYCFSFAPNPEWTRQFAPQREILEYLRGCASRYGVLPHVRFHRQVVGARWDAKLARWRVATADARDVLAWKARHGIPAGRPVPLHGDDAPAVHEVLARVLVGGMGGLSIPAYPQLPGAERFGGPAFHSAEWDHSVALRGKRVAVIGTGASAIQLVPQLAREVAELDVYQRTPPWIVPKPDREIRAWERALFRRLPFTQRLFRSAIYWRLEARGIAFNLEPRLMKLGEKEARRHLERQVADPALRAKLTPDYTLGCKRVLISDDYYPALTRENVTVVTDPIDAVTERGITGGGVERPADVIVYGTGFRPTDPVPRGMIFGRDGLDLVDAWRHGPEAYKGTVISGFPNFFMLVGPNCGLGHTSMVLMIESQIAYVLDALRVMRARNIDALEVRREAQDAFNSELQRKLSRSVWSTGGCRSWYLHESGKNVTLWPGFTFQFRRILRRLDLAAFDVHSA